MKKLKRILFILLLFSFTITSKVYAKEILDVENIKQIQNEYNVDFNIINNYEVSTTYAKLGDKLEFEIYIRNNSDSKKIILKDLTILTENIGVDYSAALNKNDLELDPNETRTIRVTGVLNNKAFNSNDIVKIQLHYNFTDESCPDCNKPIPVIINPKTGDTISIKFIILGISVIGLITLLFIVFIVKKKNNKTLLLLLLSTILLYPVIIVKADNDYLLEIIIHQKINIVKKSDTITYNKVTTPYTGNPVEGDFSSESETTINPIYYSDELCQNAIGDKPLLIGTYYATATSIGNGYYLPGQLECSNVVDITKAASACPIINDLTITYDGEEHSLEIGDGLIGGTLYYSLDGNNWTNNNINVTDAGTYAIQTKVIGDEYHTDTFCNNNLIKIEKKKDTLALQEVISDYTGNPVEAIITNESQSIITPTYYTDSSCSNSIDGLPINSGIYYVTATSSGNNNYKSSSLACSKAVEIRKLESTCPLIENVSVYYDGNNHSLEIGEGLTGGTLYYSLNEGAYNNLPVSVKSAGTYNVKTKVFGDENHLDKDCGTNTIVINKMPDSISLEQVESIYTGYPVEAYISNESNLPLNITYYSDNNCSELIEGKPLNPGIYYAKAFTEENEYYESSTLQCTKAVSINKLNDEITSSLVNQTYTGDRIDGNFTNLSNTEITPVYYSDELCQNPIEGKPKNAGIYYATATSQGNEYYEPSLLQCSKSVIINKAESICPTINDVSLIYDGNNHSLEIGEGLYGGELNYSVDGINYTPNAIEVINAGIYNIITKVKGDKNHLDKDCGTNSITIGQRNILISTSNQSKIYDGTPLEATNDCEFNEDYSGYSVSCINTGTITNVGTTEKIISNIVIKNSDNLDVTNNFITNVQNGTLKVKKSKTASIGECTNPIYTGVEQVIINPGYEVSYSINTGINVGSYNITATTTSNYAFEDGETTKEVTCSINKKQDTMNLSLVEQIYTGSSVTANITNESNTHITTTYYSDKNCSNALNGKPKNVGTYYVTATSEGNDIYESTSLTCTKAVKITKAESTCPEIGDINVIYDGNEYSLTIGSGLSGGTLYYSLNNGEWTQNEIKEKNVGVYNIRTKVVGDSNHNDKSCGENTITIDRIPKSEDTITLTDVETVYNGNPVEPSFTNLSNTKITPVYYTDSACTNSIEELPTNVGTYYATATSEGNDDYDSASLSCTKAVKITKAESTCPTITDVNVTYDGDEHSLTIGSGLSGGTLYYSLTEDDWTKTKVKVSDVGTYNVKTKVVGDSNHNDKTCGTNSITINKKDDVITVTEVETVYNGNKVDGVINSESNTEITPVYYSDELCQNAIEGKPKNAGIYYATATSEGNNIYYPGSLTCSKVITINKAESTCPTITDVNVTYDGEEHSLIIGDGIEGGTLYYSLDNVSWSESLNATNVGTYDIKTKVVGDSNHKDKTCENNTIIINQKNIQIVTSNQSKVYDGTPLEATNDCEFADALNGYNLTCSNSGYIENAGTITKKIESVVIRKDDVDVTSNFNIIPVDGILTIERVKIATLGECTNPVYNGMEQTIISGGNFVSYSIDKETNAGEYTIAVTADTNHSYEDGTNVKTVTCPISKIDITIKPNDQDIKFGTEISKSVSDVTVSGLLNSHTLNSILFTQELTDIISENDDYTYCDSDNLNDDDSCKGIKLSNANIHNLGIDVTNNYNITYIKGYLKIHYELSYLNGEHCINHSGTANLYEKELEFSSLGNSNNNDYYFIGWKVNDEFVTNFDDQSQTFTPSTMTINGNVVFVSECVDRTPPTATMTSPYNESPTDFSVYLTTSDNQSGVEKIEWYYRKCGDEKYSKMPDTVIEPVNSFSMFNNSNTCLDYGYYYVYAVVYDAAGNKTTTNPIKVSLNTPKAENILINGEKLGTGCNTLKCSLDELFEYFSSR